MRLMTWRALSIRPYHHPHLRHRLAARHLVRVYNLHAPAVAAADRAEHEKRALGATDNELVAPCRNALHLRLGTDG